ncbi:MAG: shikimate dehydrogenase [Bacteroidales bacterium]
MNTKKYGLIGYPLGHSFSRSYFTDKFKKEGIDAEYINFEVKEPFELRNIIRDNPDLCGLNVTIPHKMAVIELLDEIDETASAIGAVNVIKISRDKSGNVFLNGYNTDVTGFTNSIKPLLNTVHKKVLLLGTGGVSKAISYAFKQMGLQVLQVSREKRPDTITYKDLDEFIIKSHTVIVNATPVGMFPHINESPTIPYEYIDKRHLIFDTIYNPTETMLMKLSLAQGAIVKNGLDMLEGQAVAAWGIWNK